MDRLFGTEDFGTERSEDDPVLVIDLDGFSGPLDLLLELARRQKVDLGRISILALVDQYLAFVDEARAVRLKIAADYLVMASWLTYLKSRLLLPRAEPTDEPEAEDIAEALALRLKRLEAIRAVARLLNERPQLGRERFVRGAPEPIVTRRIPHWEASLYDLLSAYAEQRQKRALSRVRFAPRTVWTLEAARGALVPLIDAAKDWQGLEGWLAPLITEPALRPTVRASALSALLELVKEGRAEVRQSAAFAPVELKAARARPESVAA